MKKVFRLLIFFFVLFSIPSAVFASETIKDFHSDILVQTDGSVLVTESITVNREGNKIRRGIYRDLPRTKGVRYSVVSVRRDGEEESYFTERVGRYFRINTGNDDYLPRNGLYTFEITYQASNVILGFDNYDEIYWNVTGNEWIFPIERASAKVFLPEGAKEVQHAGYVGPYGSETPSDYDPETGVFSASDLDSGEGLTVAVGFDKGFTATRPSPPPLDKYVRYAALIMGAYLLITWYLFGHVSEKDAVMPRFRGIPNLSAALACWIYFHGRNKDYLAASLLEGGVSGFFKIEEKKGLKIEKVRKAKTDEERMFEKNLKFPLSLANRYSSTLHHFMDLFKTTLKQRGEQYFITNTPWFFRGGVLALALTVGLYFLADELNLAFLAGICTLLFIPVGKGIISFYTKDGFSFLKLILSFICFQFSTMIISVMLSFPEARIIAFFYIFSFVALLIYSRLIIRPTDEGVQIIAHLDGIKMFLKATDPSSTKEVDFKKMESLLPYAFLLGLKKQWEAKMKQILEGATYQPDWYDDKHFSARSFDKIHSCVSKACASPHVSDGSSRSHSGSDGGGHSGGGFGGGGGGGR